MEKSSQFEDLRSELLSTSLVRKEKNRAKLISESAKVKTFQTQLTAKLTKVKDSSKNKLKDTDALEWHAIHHGTYNLSVAKESDLTSFCCSDISEVSLDIMTARRKLLKIENNVDLQFRLWLKVNQWLKWYPGKIEAGLQFVYWDKCPMMPPPCAASMMEKKENN